MAKSRYQPEDVQRYMEKLDSKWSKFTDNTRISVYEPFKRVFITEFQRGSPYLLVNLNTYLDSMENPGTVAAQMYHQAHKDLAKVVRELRKDFYKAFEVRSGSWFTGQMQRFFG
jgi:hypothetical protein